MATDVAAEPVPAAMVASAARKETNDFEVRAQDRIA